MSESNDEETNQSSNGSTNGQVEENKSKIITNECVAFVGHILKSLSQLIEYHQKLIEEFQQEDEIKKKLNSVFCDIKPLHSVYTMIEEIINELNNEEINLPDLFLKKEIKSSLNFYKSFLNQYSSNSQWLGQFSKNNERCQKACRRLIDSDKSLTLECCHYSIFNSLFSFELMVDRYLKCFDEEDINYKNGQEVKSLFRNILVSIPQDQKQFIKAHHELRFLIGRSVIPNTNTRFIMKESVIKYSKKNNSELPRQLVLFSDYLYVTTAPHANHNCRVRQELSLKYMKVSILTVDESKKSKPKFGLNINALELNKEFYFENEETMNLWKVKLDAAIMAVNDSISSSTPPSPLGETPPVWQKDDATGYCNGLHCCIKFSSTIRRHHCRADGLIYCDQCTSYKIKLKFELSNLSKVCGTCYKILQFKNETINESADVIDAKIQLNKIFDRKTRKGKKIGWLKFIDYKRNSTSIEYFCELGDDPFLQMYKNFEDKIRSHEIILLGMEIVTTKNPKNSLPLKSNQFSLVHNDKQVGPYLFTAQDADTQKEWVKYIEESLSQYCSKF